MAPNKDEQRLVLKFTNKLATLRRFINIAKADLQQTPAADRKTLLFDLENVKRVYSGIEVIIDEGGHLLEEYEITEAMIESRDVVLQLEAAIGDQTCGTSDSQQASTAIGTTELKLPTASIPVFSGRTEEWGAFRNMFQSIVGNNRTISSAQKLLYLMGLLKGEASDIICACPIDDNNYNIAWQLLCDRYENKRLIIANHVKNLFNLPTATHSSPTEIQRLVNAIKLEVRCLETLQRPVDKWDDVLCYLVLSKLDAKLRTSFDQLHRNNEPAEFADLLQFLSSKSQSMESVYSVPSKATKEARTNVASTRRSVQCVLCKREHLLHTCGEFRALSVEQRIAKVRALKICSNCLRPGHAVNKCSSRCCFTCNKPHHTLLHLAPINTARQAEANTSNSAGNSPGARSAYSDSREQRVSSALTALKEERADVLLATSVILVSDVWGNTHEARALLDSGSQVNFITEQFRQKLCLARAKSSLVISGIEQNTISPRYAAKTTIFSRFSNYQRDVSCVIVPQITKELPSATFDASIVRIPPNIELSDPNFNISSKIDLLIGAGEFFELLCVGQLSLGSLRLQKTLLGWVVSGYQPRGANIATALHATLDDTVRKFWEIEDNNEQLIDSFANDDECEKHFSETITKSNSGRFIASLPFRENKQQLGGTYEIARKRFYSLEQKLQKDEALKSQYVDFMREYAVMKHMEPVSNDERDGCYLPHHAVLKPGSKTTKLRVVFDASTKSTSGLSLNDVLMVGPVIQSDIFTLLCRFRTHKIVVTADIAKMYRQIEVRVEDRSMQKILWRETPREPLRTYRLNTITYGTAPASFIATRCLKEQAMFAAERFPEASRCIQEDFYMDDLLTGADTEEDALQLTRDVNNILRDAGFELRKWTSSSSSVRNVYNDTHIDIVTLGDDNDVEKILGVQWDPRKDCLSFRLSSVPNGRRITKRIILSRIASIYDPLGLIGPILTTAKIIMQKLWQFQLDWDEAVPQELHTRWLIFCDSLLAITSISIPRRISTLVDTGLFYMELYGFADASQDAYGACVYLRHVNVGNISSQLMASKSRVSPLKPITIPRLELCAAQLLVRLMRAVKRACRIDFKSERYYTDSSVALAWIHGKPSRWKQFVANRVADIQQHTHPSQWRHVSGNDNPADLISRGAAPAALAANVLWWEGPAFLRESTPSAAEEPRNAPEPPEVELEARCCSATINTSPDELLVRFSNFTTMLRILSLCLRFANNARNPQHTRNTGVITAEELKSCRLAIIRKIQRQFYDDEFQALKKKNGVSRGSSLQKLNPFLDDGDIIRVGGRLRNAEISATGRTPIVLPPKCHFTRLLIRHEHERNLHSGNNATLSAIRQHHWIPTGRRAVKGVLRSCISCFKANPRAAQPLMGDLPPCRVVPSRPFAKSGVDYFGPFRVKCSKRSKIITKAYGVVFVCMATKAVHLELASDLSTAAFISALRRFISRRGFIQEIYSDNGTNFVGAHRQLSDLHKFIDDPANQEILQREATNKGFSWNFIPAHAPNFGGLWEAAVKSTKRHLYRVTKDHNMSFEELYTLLVQIEAVLNSRPLTPMSEDPDDTAVLTPGHFLIGAPLNCLPDEPLADQPQNRLTRWQMVQQMSQHFWQRWSKEYLQELQQRAKWTGHAADTVHIGDLVILKEDNSAPATWKIGRIVNVHPGSDGVTRVVSVRVRKECITRPVTKVCPLPLQGE